MTTTVEEKRETFTPGPWTSAWVGTRPHRVAVVWLGENTDKRIEIIGTNKDEANARLIASAPEMLKALKDIYEIDVPDAEWSPTLEKCFGLAREILAKVEGGGA
tara:strand:+ start:1021 stop:1332 length:312 start_codon:yes stop_codon:yes gene_type:complete